MFHSLPSVVRRRPRRRSVSEQRLPEQWSTLAVNSRVEVPVSAIEIHIPVSQQDQQNIAEIEEMMRQIQESMKQMQEDAVRQAEFSKQQATIMA